MGQGSTNLVFTRWSRNARSERAARQVEQRPEDRAQPHDEAGDHDRREHPPREDQHEDPQRTATGAVRTPARGQLAGPGAAQGCTPRRRAERARCRLERMRRKRLTSIGSCASAAGESMRALSSW